MKTTTNRSAGKRRPMPTGIGKWRESPIPNPITRLLAATGRLGPERWTTGMVMDLYWMAMNREEFAGAPIADRRTAIARIASWCQWIIGRPARERASFYMRWTELCRRRLRGFAAMRSFGGRGNGR